MPAPITNKTFFGRHPRFGVPTLLPPEVLRTCDGCDYLLLIVVLIAAMVVVRADRGSQARGAGEVVAEVIADERILAGEQPAAVSPGRVELWVPGVLAQADVMAERSQGGRIELAARVDAVVAGAIGRHRAGVVRVDGVAVDARRDRLRARLRWAGQPAVVAIDANCAVGRSRKVWLEFIDIRIRVVVDPDRGAPRRAAVE